jgi:glycosyltransferase involved in cell wall biosynthesis
MDRQIKVGWFSDYCYGGTGFGTVGKNVLTQLAATKRYEIHHFGYGITPMGILRSIKDKLEGVTDPEEKENHLNVFRFMNQEMAKYSTEECWKLCVPVEAPFAVHPCYGERYGRQFLLDACLYYDLDCVVVNLDPWMTSWLTMYSNTQWDKPCPVIYYQPIDAVCHNNYSPHIVIPDADGTVLDANRLSWAQMYCLQEYSVFYGDWSLQLAQGQIDREIRPNTPELADRAKLYAIRHGIELDKFHPIPKDIARDKMGIPRDAFVVGMVAANQGRKNWPAFIQVMKKVGDMYPNTHFLMWTAMCKYPDSFDLQKLIADFDVKATWVKLPFLEKLTPPAEFVNIAYNSMDVHLLMTLGEGCGLPHVEATAASVPAFATDYAGIKDYFADPLQALPTDCWRIGSPNLLYRPGTNIDETVNRVKWVHDNPEEAMKWATKCRGVASTWGWENTTSDWEEVIQDAARMKLSWDTDYAKEREEKWHTLIQNDPMP